MKLFNYLGLTYLIVLLSLLQFSECFYDSSSNVVELTPSNFDSRVINSDGIWIVEFYAPWCGHCQSLVPEYKKAANALRGIVNVGAVNADEHKSLGGQYGIQGFPTIKIFVNGKSVDYNGPRSASGFVDTAFTEAKKLAQNRLNGKSGSGKTGGDKKSSADAVVELTDANFEKLVLNSDDIWMVEFFAPWCGHCKRLEPIWAEAAGDMIGKVKFGALDATVHTITASKYGIKGFPTIKYFGSSNKDMPEDYNGGRTKSDLVSFASDKFNQNRPAPEVKQLKDEQSLKEACDSNQLCIISFLPHILDCNAKCRNDYIDTLKKVAEKYKSNQWSYLWAESGAEFNLEESLGIGGFGYPAMAALNVRKMKYSGLRGSFSFDGISEFLRELSYGKGSSLPVRGAKLPAIEKVEPWDGKDGVPPVEESDHEEL